MSGVESEAEKMFKPLVHFACAVSLSEELEPAG